jgi:hypothetical protein
MPTVSGPSRSGVFRLGSRIKFCPAGAGEGRFAVRRHSRRAKHGSRPGNGVLRHCSLYSCRSGGEIHARRPRVRRVAAPRSQGSSTARDSPGGSGQGPLRRPRGGECRGVRGCSAVHRVASLIDLEGHRNPFPVLCAVSDTTRRGCITRFPVAPAAWPTSSRPEIAEFVSTNAGDLSFHRGGDHAALSARWNAEGFRTRRGSGLVSVREESASSDPPLKSAAGRA